MTTRVAIALGAIALLGLLVVRVDRRKPRPRPAPSTRTSTSPRVDPLPRDDFDLLIAALEAGTCEWISSPVRQGNRLAVTIGNGSTHSYTFRPTDDRLMQLRQVVDRNHVLMPQGTAAR